MQYNSISEIYDSNDLIHAKLRETVAPLSDEQANTRLDGENWTIAQIVEHVSMVSGGIQRICAKLLSKAEAEGSLSSGKIDMETLAAKYVESAEQKLEAPEVVHPTGNKAIAESLAALDETQSGLRRLHPTFEKYDGNSPKFPHPYFGDLSALEWLVLAGGHEARHTRQIEKLLEKIG